MDTLTTILVCVVFAGIAVGLTAEHFGLRKRVPEPRRGRLAPHQPIKRTWP